LPPCPHAPAVAATPLFHTQRLILPDGCFCYTQCALSFWMAASCLVRGVCARAVHWACMASGMIRVLIWLPLSLRSESLFLFDRSRMGRALCRPVFPLDFAVALTGDCDFGAHCVRTSVPRIATAVEGALRYPTATMTKRRRPFQTRQRENAGWLLVCVHRSPCLLALLVNIFLSASAAGRAVALFLLSLSLSSDAAGRALSFCAAVSRAAPSSLSLLHV